MARGLDLQPQRLEIVGCGHEVRFRLQIIGRVSAKEICIGERTKLAAFHKGFQFLLDRPEIFGGCRTCGYGRRQLGRLDKIGGKSGSHIDKIKSMQMVKMHNVIVHIQHAHHKVSNICGIGGNGNANGILKSASRSQSVRIGAYAAGSLG